MLIRILLGICAALLLAVLGLSWYAKSATERAATASSQVSGYRAALEAQNARLADYAASLEARERARQEADQRAADWRRKWRDALDDKPTADWAAGPLPAAAADRVRELSRPDPDHPTPDRPPAGPDPTAVLRGRD